MYQQRHFENIARVFQDTKPSASGYALEQWTTLRNAFSDVFARENIRFDRDRFIRACEPGANVRKRVV